MTSREKMQILARACASKNDIDTHFVNDGCGELFYDDWSGDFFRTTKLALLWAEIFANKMLHTEGVCYLNDFYEKLGIMTLKEEYYWTLSGRCQWIHFDHIYVDHEDEEEQFYYIIFIPEPLRVPIGADRK